MTHMQHQIFNYYYLMYQMLLVRGSHLHFYLELYLRFVISDTLHLQIYFGVTFTSFKGSCVASLSKTHIRYNCINNSAAGFIDERSSKVNTSPHVSSYFGMMFDVLRVESFDFRPSFQVIFKDCRFSLLFSKQS